MQRWIVLGALVLTLLGSGSVFGYWKHRQNTPDRQWVELPFNPESTQAQRDKSVEELRKALLTETVLTGIARDCGIEAIWELGSEQAAVEELRRRVVIEEGETTYKGIPTSTLNVGFRGIVAERPELIELAERMSKDVQRLVNPESQQTPAGTTSSMPKF
ncbi:hypothetical protein OKA04_21680 [Luteolibacter flavescens]|uniref:Uncharacterized protein n=1 Tax=Luteolibacter flavescens TaxID=1859460 RepID=A0ABT3FUW8_9BACT|nr:hypothetical protein [Luteolibacter flavescens]MCW1887363.1 hypothetical protein [Luteolibacter flavescens]